jgi:hypothetical protein
MKVEDIQALGRGDLIYRVDESGGTPRVVEYRYDFPQIAKLSADTLDLSEFHQTIQRLTNGSKCDIRCFNNFARSGKTDRR